MTTRPDVLVLGGGPAGAAAAHLLARWGHRVQLRTRGAPPAPLPESIPPSTARLFDLLGVTSQIDAAGFVRSTGNTVWWGSAPPRVEAFARGTCGWQVTSDRLAKLLLRHARAAGVEVRGARATPQDATDGAAPFVLDCTGRAGVLARARGLRVAEARHQTVALVGRWRAPGPFALPDTTHTLIESYDDGWAWSVPAGADDRFVALMVDPRRSALARERPAREIYVNELNKTRHMRALVAAAALVDGPAGWNASMYRADRYVDDHVLLVGDAGSFIDPLSSAGVKKALASGWLAAVAVHTSLTRPAMRDTALAYYDAREREVYAAFRAMTERMLADAAAGHAHPFWTDRTDANPDPASPPAQVEAAFAWLRAAPTLSVMANPAASVQSRPAVTGHEIVMEPRLVSAACPQGARYAFGVDLLPLVRLAPDHRSVPDLFAAYTAAHQPVALPDFLGALATAIAQNWLVPCDTS